MIRTGFHYRVEGVVEFTGLDLSVLSSLSASHYDGRCKAVFSSGGFGHGWLMQFLYDAGDTALSLLDIDLANLTPELAARKVEAVVTGSQVDLLCKVLEAAQFVPLSDEHRVVAAELMKNLGQVFRAMNDESRRLHGRGEAV